MATQISDKEINNFVSKVQRLLIGLSAEEKSELTENLVIDLQEKRDAEGTKFQLGDPKKYADELADAAGLKLKNYELSPANMKLLKLANTVGEYLKTLNPAWVLVRGWLVYSLIYSPIMYREVREIPDRALDLLVLIVLVLASFWLDRKKFKSLKYPLIVLNIGLMLVSPAVILDSNSRIENYRRWMALEQSDNLVFMGQAIHEVCAYDEYGNATPVIKLTDSEGWEIFRLHELPAPVCHRS